MKINNLDMVRLFLLVGLATSSRRETVTSCGTNRFITGSPPTRNFHDETLDRRLLSPLLVHADCTKSHISLSTSNSDDGGTLLVVFVQEDYDVEQLTSLACEVHLTSQSHDNISAVLLEHSPCGGGVFVLLSDNIEHRRWDVCSVWRAPGPDFTTLSNTLDISFELFDNSEPRNFTISARAVESHLLGELEIRYLSPKEGKLFVCVCVCVFFFFYFFYLLFMTDVLVALLDGEGGGGGGSR